MRLLLLCIVIGIAAVIVIRALANGIQRKKCTGKTTARFMYSDSTESPNTQKIPNLWIPVYEFYAVDKAYVVKSGKTGPSEKSFPFEAQVLYNTDDPTICFIDGIRGKVLSVNDIPESAKKENAENIENDPWAAYDDDSRYEYFNKNDL